MYDEDYVSSNPSLVFIENCLNMHSWPFFINTKSRDMNQYVSNVVGKLEYYNNHNKIFPILVNDKNDDCWLASIYLCKVSCIKDIINRLPNLNWISIFFIKLSVFAR